MTAHKHAELIKAWADGAEIQVYKPHWDEWHDCQTPIWDSDEYRIKPRDHVIRALAIFGRDIVYEGCLLKEWIVGKQPNLKLVYDGETRELKSSEVLK